MERRLAAILAADVVGYSRLMGEDEAGTYVALKTLREELIEPLISAHEGRIIKLMGDGILAAFTSAVQAVSSAAAIQRALAERNVDPPANRPIHVRIGINLGDVIVEGDDLYGDGVNLAARLEGIADPGGICVSRNVYEQVHGKVDVAFRDLGVRKVKNIPEPVHVFAAVPSGEKAAVAKPARRRRVTPARLVGSAVVVALVVAGGVAAWLRPWSPGIEPASMARMALPLPDEPSIAVLPFANTSGDLEQEYFADGITDDLTTDLSKLAGLFVISRNSAFTYKGKVVKVRDVAEELGVRYVLEGSVRRAGDQMRINVRLVDALDGKALWAERYDRALTGIFELQDDITGRIADALRVEFAGAADDTALEQHQTESAEAYDLVLRARKLLNRFDRKEADEARDLLERGIDLDGGYARAYGLLAHYYLDLWRLWGEDRDRNLSRAEDYAERAAALDPRDAGPHVSLAQVSMFRRDFDKADAEADAALARAPGDAVALANLGSMLRYIHRPEEAADVLDRAIRLDPFHPAYYLEWLGDAYFLLDRLDECVDVLERGIALEPDFVALHVISAKCYAALGDDDKARKAVAEILRNNPNFTVTAFASYVPFSAAGDLRHNVEMLRKAGAPE
jgi:TolB-like protein/class 3 adenylate cyclase/Tfp pilus assembly protein PilF